MKGSQTPGRQNASIPVGDVAQEASARLAAIINSSDDAIIAKSLDGIILSWNPAAEALYGYSADEVAGHHISLLVPPEGSDDVTAVLDRIKEGQAVRHYETVRVAKDGRRIDVSLTVSPVRDSSGTIVAASTIARDVSERKRVEGVMRQQAAAVEEQARLLDLTHDSIIVRDVDDAITFWNTGAEASYGWSRDEAMGKRSQDLLRTELPEPLADIITTLQDRGRWDGELIRRSRSGRQIVVSSRWSLRRGEDGRPQAYLEINNDITEKKQAEEEMAAAKAAAEAASVAKSEFLANMSHEIRTPMNGVLGMCGLLLDTGLDAEQREYAETVRTSAEALLAVINDILDFSKVEAGKVELELVDFAVRSTVEEVAELLAEQGAIKGIELSTLVELEVPQAVRGDAGRVRQVLLNLVSNAVKFTAEGEVEVRVSLMNEAEDEVALRFSVRDTGIGITAEVQASLFRSFSQGDVSTTRRYGGTGLGLAISKQLVGLMGGEIGLESEVGRGSTFWFTARLLRTADGGVPRASGNGTLVGLRALVVDDNATNRTILVHNLRSFRMHPESADDGSQALAMLRAAVSQGNPYAVAVLDFHMPVMDGIELAQAINRDSLLSGLPLVLLTSKGERGDSRLARGAGIGAFLTKPVRVAALSDGLKAVMGYVAPASPSSPSAPPGAAGGAAKRRVLVVEDNVVNQKVARGMLESLGYRIDIAANGIESVQAIAEVPYDVVLMDCQMPEMDGYQATAEIRRIEVGRRHIPIIAMTAGAMAQDEERARDSGMDDYVTKPVNRERLAAVLDRWTGAADPASGK